MIYFTDIHGLLNEWECRTSSSEDANYTLAIQECIYDLRKLVDNAIDQQNKDWEAEKARYAKELEDEVYKTLLEDEADDYLASMEAHEHIA